MKKSNFFIIAVFILILSISAYFRLHNLGYSEFQGDEVAAQNYLFDERNFAKFLVTRTIGPGQYVISYAMNLFFYAYNPEFFIRLPFALVGILTNIYIFFIVKKFINIQTALISSSLIALSGLLIAFSRIVQYQNFVMFFAIVTLGIIYEFISKGKYSLIYLAGITGGLGLLFHYDALAFIIPSVIILLLAKEYKAAGIFIAALTIISAIFYIPLILQPEFKQTFKYLVQGRISSNSQNDNLFYTLKLLSIYHSKELLIFILGGIGLWVGSLWKNSKLVTKIFILLSIIACTLRSISIQKNNYLVYISLGAVSVILFLLMQSYKKRSRLLFINVMEIWFLVAFITYILLFSKSLTHFYTAVIPAFIIVSYYWGNLLITKKTWALVPVLVALISAISFDSKAFIETKTEYPWNKKQYIFGKMPTEISESAKIDGIFGFPYKRNWREIERVISRSICKKLSCKYSSNEKYRLTKYYMQSHKWSDSDWEILIVIEKPQSLVQNTLPVGYTYIKRFESPMYIIYQKVARNEI